jgi:hypothetical protein
MFSRIFFGKTRTVINLTVGMLVLISLLGSTVPSVANASSSASISSSDHVLNPGISINKSFNEIAGWDWPIGETVTITIDDPGNGTGVDFTGTAIVVTADPDYGAFLLQTLEFDLDTGQSVTVTGGGYTVTSTINALTITGMDVETDTVYGKAAPGSLVDINVRDIYINYGFRQVSTDSAGDWLADFSILGTNPWESDIIDIAKGSVADAYQMDGSVTEIAVSWHVPNPNMIIELRSNDILGRDWIIGTTVTITIDDPSNGIGIDYTNTAEVEGDPRDRIHYPGFYLLPAGFTLRSGQQVSMTDGTNTISYEIPVLRITDIDIVADTVTGMATPGMQLSVSMYDDQAWALRSIDIPASGIWVANFAHGESPEDILDIHAGTNYGIWESGTLESNPVEGATNLYGEVPYDTDGDGLNDDVDACPSENPDGYDADRDGCSDTAASLKIYLTNLPSGLIPTNIKTNLLSNINSVIKFLNSNKYQPAIDQFNQFISLVKAQQGKKIPGDTASILISYAENVIAQIPK